MAPIQYNMIKIDYGWINQPVTNIWGLLYYLYYFVYIVSSLIIVWKWKKGFKTQSIVKLSNLFFLTFFLTLLVGTFNDTLGALVFKNHMPQMAPLIALYPVWVMYYLARHYDVMKKERQGKNDIIVTEEDKKNIFSNLSLAFYTAAVLAFISEYLPYASQENAIYRALIKALSVLAIGVIIRIIQNIKKESLRENLTIILLVLSIPIILFQYVKYGSITVWAFPMVIIISSVIFSRRTLLVSTTVAAIISQILIWRMNPKIIVLVDEFDYILRIGMFIVAFLVGRFINKLYVAKIKKINFMAYYDQLTKLPNRYLFADRVNQGLDLAMESGESICLIMMDLDNFKIVNDTMGHSTGDLLLIKIADALNKLVEDKGIVARVGGDEFMIMLTNIREHKQIISIANKLMDLFSQPFHINGRNFFITVSAGISTYPIDGWDSETLTKNADLAMHEAKAMGKNQYVLCTDQMKQAVENNMNLSNDMYQALERGEFQVYYQPQVDLMTGAINGLEALLRWNHPEKGKISPGIFIPIAESNGIINSIGEWVLRMACIQNKKWHKMGFKNLSMAVNLSAVQFLDPNIADNIQNILEETGLEPRYLELEITEGIAIEQETHAEEVLSKLKAIGVGIAIDDFGTQYSSLSRLKILPINRIKIDMQFIQGIEESEKDRAIVMVIINLAKHLGMNVIAEGAETAGQVEFLRIQLCDDVQGYYYYKPMPARETEKELIKMK